MAVASVSPSSEDATDRLQQALGNVRRGRNDLAERQAMMLVHDDDPAAHDAWLVVATARTRRKRFAGAIEAYRAYLAGCESSRLRAFVLRQMESCRASMKITSTAPAPSERLAHGDLRELAEVDRQVHVESSPHFVVRSRNQRLSKLLAEQAEADLRRICHRILGGQEFAHSVDVYVWADHARFLENAADAPEWAGGSYSISMNNGFVTRRIDLTQLDADGRFATVMLDRVLPHEMCHIVLREHFQDAPLPLFLDEGLAMLSEATVDNERVAQAAATLAGTDRISLPRLLVLRRKDLTRPRGFYAEAFSFTEFVHSRLSREQFRDFLSHLKAGHAVADALERALYRPAEEDFLAQLSEAWEDHAIAQGQVLRELQRAATADSLYGQ